jgi:cystathionine beta-lyase/cystathionine gamma-synthase
MVPRPAIATTAARGLRAEPPPGHDGRPAAEPLYQTSVFEFSSIDATEPALEGRSGYAYVRNGLPNARSLELTVAALEGAEACLATSSGMAAILAAVLATTEPGDKVLCQSDAYGGTRAMLQQDLPRMGLTVEYVDAHDNARVADALAGGARLLLVETLSNPLIREVDVAALAWHCRANHAFLCVDNTFASPVFRRPITLGADLVLHSATKFLGGHHDLCAGVLASGQAIIDRARGFAQRMGFLAAPFDAWLAARGIKSLDVRMQRSQDNARLLAERLGAHPRVVAVHYPGWGPMLSFDVGDRAAAARVVSNAREIHLSPSLGGTETSFSHSASSSHRALSVTERARLGIGDGLLRMSVGLEDAEDIWNELLRALS